MVVNISADRMQAVVKQISFGGHADLSHRDITTALTEQYDIKHGLDGDAVAELAEKCLEDPEETVQGNFVVALGTLAKPGTNGRIEYAYLKEHSGPLPAYRQIKDAFEQKTIEAVLAKSTECIWVMPGDELATVIAATPGTPGREVLGNSIEKPGEEVSLEAGSNVSQTDNRFIADQMGYVCQIQDTLSVIPPIWITEDSMRAYFVHFPLPKSHPSIGSEVLQATLNECGVKSGFVTKNIELVSQKPLPHTQPKARLIARGTPPAHGQGARMDLGFNPEKLAGKINPDGSIDLRERNSVIAVEEGQLLGTLIQATQGQAGIDVCGNALTANDGDDSLSFTAGENVRSEGNPPTQFYAMTSGNVHVGKGSIDVKQVFVVSGNVDYEVGNIDTPHDVQINGDVGSGFTVKAGGSITVGGNVESGATLRAKGDIIISRGIIGGGTSVVALGALSEGCVQAQFILNAAVAAKGDIEIGSYAFNSMLRSNSNITVHPGGGDRGGSIVGGEAIAAHCITCQYAGSATTSGTLISISADPKVSAQINKINEQVDFCDSNSMRLLRTLGLEEANSAQIKVVLRNTAPGKKRIVREVVKKLYDLLEIREKSFNQREELKKMLDSSLENAEIVVTGKAFAGVRLVMGNSEDTLIADHVGFCFRLESMGIEAKPITSTEEGEDGQASSEEQASSDRS